MGNGGITGAKKVLVRFDGKKWDYHPQRTPIEYFPDDQQKLIRADAKQTVHRTVHNTEWWPAQWTLNSFHHEEYQKQLDEIKENISTFLSSFQQENLKAPSAKMIQIINRCMGTENDRLKLLKELRFPLFERFYKTLPTPELLECVPVGEECPTDFRKVGLVSNVRYSESPTEMIASIKEVTSGEWGRDNGIPLTSFNLRTWYPFFQREREELDKFIVYMSNLDTNNNAESLLQFGRFLQNVVDQQRRYQAQKWFWAKNDTKVVQLLKNNNHNNLTEHLKKLKKIVDANAQKPNDAGCRPESGTQIRRLAEVSGDSPSLTPLISGALILLLCFLFYFIVRRVQRARSRKPSREGVFEEFDALNRLS